MAPQTYTSIHLSKRPKTNIIPGETFEARNTRSYIPPVKIGEVMRGVAIGIIIASKSKSYPIGTHVTATAGWTEYAILKESDLQRVDIPKNGRITDVLGVLGMTGLTAYFGLLDIGKVRAGDFVVVSGAAGATGSIVGQIAKLKGAKVLGIAGSEEKVRWLKEELGFDDALCYKDEQFAAKFRGATKSAAKSSTSRSREQNHMLDSSSVEV
ncbi:MAG: hypothetical protein Q9170_004687 [Blastenia crenularia]